jgi:VWFA-related protein
MTRFGVRFGISLLAGLGICLAVLGAQQRQPMFRAATRLVEVSVTVVDKKGQAVTGLTPADFVVTDQGKPRTVDIFHFDGGRDVGTAAPAPVAAPGVFTNLPILSEDAPRNVTALVLDSLNTPPRFSGSSRVQLLRYLKTLAPRTVTAVYLMANQLFVLHDFSDDAAALRAKVEKANLPVSTMRETDTMQSIVEAESFLRSFTEDSKDSMVPFLNTSLRADAVADAAIKADRVQQSLAQIEALGAHMAEIPGRKSVVWIGGGFSMVAITATTQGQKSTPEILEIHENAVRQTSRRLAQQGIALYVVDANRVEASAATRAQMPQATAQRGRGNFEVFQDTAMMSADTKSPMQTMAAITGGRYFYPDDATSGVDTFMTDLRAGYTLGFYVAETPDDKWHKLKVQVKRPGVTVRHREGYLLDATQTKPVAWTDDVWQAALSNPILSSAIPLTVSVKRTPAGELVVTVLADTATLQYAPNGDTLDAILDVLIADRAVDGPGRIHRSRVSSSVPVALWEGVRTKPTRYERAWTPAANATSLRVIVHDPNTGKYGSVDVPLSKVPR